MTFGEKLSKARKENNYTQEQLADILGVSPQSISKWESEKAYPEMDKLLVICDLFDVTLDDLVIGDVARPRRNASPAQGHADESDDTGVPAAII